MYDSTKKREAPHEEKPTYEPSFNMISISQENMRHKHTIIKNLDEEVVIDPKASFSRLNNNDLEIINIICYLCAKHETTHVSQSTLAQWTKLTRRQINRIMKKICGLGIVAKIFREYNTSIYFMHDFFKDIKIKKALKAFVPNITLLAFSCRKLFSIVTSPLAKPVKKMLHYYPPFFRDSEFGGSTRHPQGRGFNSMEYIEACLNIRVKNRQ